MSNTRARCMLVLTVLVCAGAFAILWHAGYHHEAWGVPLFAAYSAWMALLIAHLTTKWPWRVLFLLSCWAWWAWRIWPTPWQFVRYEDDTNTVVYQNRI